MYLRATLILLLACSGAEIQDPGTKPAADPVQQPAPAINTRPPANTNTLTIIGEAELSALLTKPAGRRQVISFWATWCTPCVVEVVLLNALAIVHKDIDFILVNIDHPSMLERRVAPFLRERRLSEAKLYHLDSNDPNVSLAKLVPNWPDSIPVTLIKDEAGQTREQFNTNVTRKQLEEALERASHY